MLRQPTQIFVRFCFAITCAALSLAPSLNGEVLPYRSYTAPEGTHYFAIGLQATEQPAVQPVEVVFLVDTSAGQGGQARLDTLQAIVSAINHLPQGTRIQILAMDVETEPLTDQFYAKGSPEIEAALGTLHRRLPLGATDFGKGLETVRKTFENGSGNARRSVLYLGGGRSMAKTISREVFEKEAEAFTEMKIPFTACAIGMRTNFGFITAFANRTGGNLIDTAPSELKIEGIDDKRVDIRIEQIDWKKVGQQIADFATATVVWVDSTSVNFPEDWTVFPVQVQPLRSDRATILVGAADSETLPAFDLSLTGATAEGKVDLVIPLTPARSVASNNYLRAVVETAAQDGGAVMPIVGWDSLLYIQESFIADVENQIDKANTAMTMGHYQQATTILVDVLNAEPDNKIAQNMFEMATEQMNGAANGVARGLAQDGGAASGEGMRVPTASSFIDSAILAQSLSLDKIRQEVRVAITEAAQRTRGTAPDFDGAIQGLKLTQQIVRSNTALAPASRDALLTQLGNSIREVERIRFEQEYRDVREAANIAIQRSRVEALSAGQADRERAIQVFDRFRALMQAGEFGPATIVADHAVEVLPDHPAPYFARRMSQLLGYVQEYDELRHRRHIGFLETLMAAERSFIPIPDEPPFTYIDKDRWRLLSDYRKEKYSSVALFDPDESIKTIKAVLESRDIQLDIDEFTTFADLFRMIRDELRRLKMPDINIALDTQALRNTATTIRSDTPVAPEGYEPSRMRLRNTLIRLLSPHDLTYVIREESLLITTIEESRKRENMFIKIYPVGDIFMLEGGMMGGGMGGGGWGGGGGNWGGGGGNWGGGGGNWGGGNNRSAYGGGNNNRQGNNRNNRWSVPDEITRSTASQTTQLIQEAQSANDSNLFWTEYFDQEDVDPDAVKDVVRRLSGGLKEKPENADQIIALIEAAILSGNAQPWMYEALTLSLYLKGAPKAQILRAALSAADFCETPMDLLNVGFVMRIALDLKQYAFPLYQQALENLPPRREIYAATLRLAEELFDQYDDEEPLRWIGLGIVSQEWEGALGAKLVQDADRALATLGNRLARQKRDEEARQLAYDIRNAKLRDCIVTIEWTGEAGIDLMVYEPSGSLCWFKNPRSMSGGLLKTTPALMSLRVSNPSAARSISYIVPQGFNGKYSLLLQKSWGNLTNDLVKVSIATNAVPGESVPQEMAYRMDPEGIVVSFSLETGRRTESEHEAKLERADVQMAAAHRAAVRNTRLWNMQDDAVLWQPDDVPPQPQPDTLVIPVQTTTAPSAPVTIVETAGINDWLYGSRYIGYAPEIDLLDVGTYFELYPGDVAVSPDRRYIFMRVEELEFTTLRSVNEYEFGVTGSDGNTTTVSGSSAN